jgi:hypothetical protein
MPGTLRSRKGKLRETTLSSKRLVTALLAGAVTAGTTLMGAIAPAAAQTYYQPPPVRAEARAREVRGIVTSFYRYNMSISSRGQNVPVQLHQGTIIEPTGAAMQPGMRVTLRGYWTNGVFVANRIIVR